MKTDFYTKAVLTVIAVMLSVIAAKQFTQPATVVHADTSPSQFAVGPNATFYIYNPNSGMVASWGPDGTRRTKVTLGN